MTSESGVEGVGTAMRIVWVAIRLDVHESYGLGVDAVWKPLGPRPGAPIPLAAWYQGEQSMTRVAGVF
jgi:hypothetical protein